MLLLYLIGGEIQSTLRISFREAPGDSVTQQSDREYLKLESIEAGKHHLPSKSHLHVPIEASGVTPIC